jgi:hypothetical protein
VVRTHCLVISLSLSPVPSGGHCRTQVCDLAQEPPVRDNQGNTHLVIMRLCMLYLQVYYLDQQSTKSDSAIEYDASDSKEGSR